MESKLSGVDIAKFKTRLNNLWPSIYLNVGIFYSDTYSENDRFYSGSIFFIVECKREANDLEKEGITQCIREFLHPGKKWTIRFRSKNVELMDFINHELAKL